MSSGRQLRRNLYKCDICRDTGWTLEPQRDAAPLARECQCMEMDKIKRQWIEAGINPELSNLTFKNFMVWNESSKRIKDTARAYYMNFDEIRRSRHNSILFCGQVGSGKSHASIALALNFLRKGIKVLYVSYRDMMTSAKQSKFDAKNYSKIISKCQNCEVLLLDDMFKGKIDGEDLNIIFEIINYRYMNFLPIICSTEFTMERLLNYDEGIGSRIKEMCEGYIVEIKRDKMDNYRLK
jgi:DNA replication protein DnaC